MDMTSILYNVLSGTANDVERKEFSEWLALNEVNKEEYNNLKLLWDSKKDSNESVLDQHFYDGLRQIMILMRTKHHKQERKKVLILIGIAISVIVVANFCFAYIYSSPGSYTYHKFDNASLEKIIDVLEKDYNIAIEIENEEIRACKFTGTFYKGTVNDILLSISKALDLRYEKVSDGRYKLAGIWCITQPQQNK